MPSGFYSTKDVSGTTIAAQDIDNRFQQTAKFCNISLSANQLMTSTVVTADFATYNASLSTVNFFSSTNKGFVIPSYANYARFSLIYNANNTQDTTSLNYFISYTLYKNGASQYLSMHQLIPWEKKSGGTTIQGMISSPIIKVAPNDVFQIVMMTSNGASVVTIQTTTHFQCEILG
jgi:hypothetical protein